MDLQAQQGLMTTYREAWRTRGAPAWVASGLLVACYCILYWTDWLDGPAAAIPRLVQTGNFLRDKGARAATELLKGRLAELRATLGADVFDPLLWSA